MGSLEATRHYGRGEDTIRRGVLMVPSGSHSGLDIARAATMVEWAVEAMKEKLRVDGGHRRRRESRIDRNGVH